MHSLVSNHPICLQVLTEVNQQIHVSVASAGKKAGQELLKKLPVTVKDDVFQVGTDPPVLVRALKALVRSVSTLAFWFR
jgi:hypothetical protein